VSAHITVSVACSERSVPVGTTAAELFTERSKGPQTVVVALVGKELRDLGWVLRDGDLVEPVTVDSPQGLAVLRHSSAHVLVQAMQELHPQAKLGIGPPIQDGFYYDFELPQPLTPANLKVLEKSMQRIINEGQTFHRCEVPDAQAQQKLAAKPYKLELIGLKGSAAGTEGAAAEVGEGDLTTYQNFRRDGSLAWQDLCRGPHLPNTKIIGNAFSLMRSAAAYWRGQEDNPQLQRVYGTAWPSKDYLQDVVAQLRSQGIRAELDATDDRFPKKIRNAQKSKIPIMLIAGEDDVQHQAVSFRFRDGAQKNGVPLAEAFAELALAVQPPRKAANRD
jgi:threonyl-tRNA synthetase